MTLDIIACRNVDIFVSNHLGDVISNKVEDAIDLGVTVDNKLTFAKHISKVVSKAKQRVFLLFRSFVAKNVAYLLQGYKSFILPSILYCSPVWSPLTVKEIKAVESVQRVFYQEASRHGDSKLRREM